MVGYLSESIPEFPDPIAKHEIQGEQTLFSPVQIKPSGITEHRPVVIKVSFKLSWDETLICQLIWAMASHDPSYIYMYIHNIAVCRVILISWRQVTR